MWSLDNFKLEHRKYVFVVLCSPLSLLAAVKMIIAPWGLTIKPGATYQYEIPPFVNLKISNAALGAVLEDEHSRTTLTIEAVDHHSTDSEDEDEEELDEDKPPPTKIVLTSLTPGKVGRFLIDYFAYSSIFQWKIEQSIHDITFSFPALLRIKAFGKKWVYRLF